MFLQTRKLALGISGCYEVTHFVYWGTVYQRHAFPVKNDIKSTLIYPRTGAAHIEQYVNNKQSQTHGATNALRR